MFRRRCGYFRDHGVGRILSALAGILAAMGADLPARLRLAADEQRGIISCSQIVESGLTRGILISRLKRGRWQRLCPGVYATFSGEPSREAVLWAAVLYAGPGAALSHQTAAELWRLTDEASAVVHVTVPTRRRVRAVTGMAVHYSAAVAAHPAQTPPRTRVEETVIDLWETSRSLDTAVGWVTRAIGRQRTTGDKLRLAVSTRSRVRWRSKLTELLDMDGVHSVLEYRYVRDVERRHGLPAATRQLHARLDGHSQYRDEVYEEYQTVVELDGRMAHPGDTRWEDIRRDNAAASTGLITLRYGWLPVRATPCRVAAEVDDVLSLRGFPGARPCSADCPVGRGSYRSSLVRARSVRLLRGLGAEERGGGEATSGES